MMTSGGNVMQLTHGEDLLQLARWPNLGTPASATGSGFADYVTQGGPANTTARNAIYYGERPGGAGAGPGRNR
jgi:hypothetical protein